MSKEEISKSYLDEMKRQCAHLTRPKNPRLFVTGTTRNGNIGQAICQEIDRNGWDWEEFGGDIRQVVQYPKLDGFDALVCCHGVNHMDWFENQTYAKIIEQIDINLTGTAKMIYKFVGDTWKSPYRKSIVVMGSMAHRNVLNGSSIYCASKAGLAMLVRCLAWELAPKGYDVYCIHPSNVVDAPMSEDTIKGLMRYRGLTREQAEAYWGAVCPSLDGFLTKGEIARLTCDLVTGAYPYMSGSQIELVGGQR